MAVVINGGSITNTGGGTFTAPGLITGNGSISGPMTINGGLTATGGTLTVDGTAGTGITIGATGWSSSSGSVLDMKGTFNYPTTGGFLNPGGGTIQFDGATLNNAGRTIYTGAGSIVANSGVNTQNTAMIPNGSNGSVPNYTVNNGATLNVNNTNALNAAIYANNFTMQNNSKLSDAGANKTFNLAGNFSFQQTDPVNAWTYGATSGLGPDLNMNGGKSSTSPATQSLEVGGINQGYTPGAFTNNFALDSLTVGSYTTVDLVDQYPNATPSGWVSGEEALYLDALFGAAPVGGSPTAVLDEMGLYVYLQGYGQLTNGIYLAPDGTEVSVIDAPGMGAAPAPLIGRGVPLFVVVGGFLFGVRLLERGKKFGGLGPIRNIIRRRLAVIGAG
jgi:hypothetical protein